MINNRIKLGIACIVAGISITGCGSSDDNSKLSYINTANIAGDMTHTGAAKYTQQAYAQPADNLTDSQLELHLAGDANFETNFLGTSNSSAYQAGLGPVQNNTNCDKCHPSDGRASLPWVPHRNFDNTMGQLDMGDGWRKLRSAGVFLRISIENNNTNTASKTKDNWWGSPVGVPDFSDQLFHRGSLGLRDSATEGLNAGQADVWMKYVDKNITYPDGTEITLTRPILLADNPYDNPDNPRVYNVTTQESNATSELFKDDVKFGIRIGMPVFALGLLDTMKESDILALADINDSDGDGISGKPNFVFDKEKYDYCSNLDNNYSCEDNPPLSLGRYGWKANTPTAAHQGLGAMRGDMGVTNPLFKMENIAMTPLMTTYKNYAGASFQTYCDTNNSAQLDANMEQAQSIIFYTETLSVPSRRDINDEEVIKGAKLFDTVGCIKCHAVGSKERLSQGLDGFLTGNKSGSYSIKYDRNPYLDGDNEHNDSKISQLENQLIYPFTDGLLHDMGDDLSDGRKDGDANGNEWKTRPLWGIGMTQKVHPVAGFLHDGRARTLEEAILWHGGEADSIKNEFMQLDKTSRDALIKFLEDL